MQLVIEIPDEMYDWYDNGFPDEDNAEKLWQIVKNGTPLPKGHGRIVDGDEILIWLMYKGIIDKLKCGEIAPVFEHATIISADKEEK